MKTVIIALLPWILGGISLAQPVQTDWLITPPPQTTSVITKQEKQEITLTNGLIRRTWRLSPNAATVGFDNLMTGESLLRGVKPEARIEINHLKFSIGGLIGQPDYAYLLPEWIDQLRTDDQAFQFVDYQTGSTQVRFAWKRKRHCEDRPWPSPGKSLTLNFHLATDQVKQLMSDRLLISNENRIALLKSDFTDDLDAWTLHRSPHQNSTFTHEGKPGEIVTPANTSVYAERKLPTGVRILQCRIEPGTDAAASWGPGITVLWPNRIIKFNLRTGANQFGIFDGSNERLLGTVDTTKTYTLRIEITESAVFCDASQDGKNWQLIHKIPLSSALGDPQSVRVGKTGRTGGKEDYTQPGPYGLCRISSVQAFGDLTPAAREAQRKQMAWVSKLRVSVHYEMYDQIPLLCKWLTLHNGSAQTVTLNRFTSEILAVVEYESHVEEYEKWNVPNLHVESDYAFSGMNALVANHTTHWIADPEYVTQVHYQRQNPCLLESRPPLGPELAIAPGETFESFRTFELVYDSTERERKSLALRRMYRTIAPWVTENPLMMHVRYADPASVRRAVDQCAEVGFEMIILTFGSGFNIENEDPKYLAHWKELADYAHSKGIEIGGYSLLSSRRIGPEQDVIDVNTGKPGGAKFGNAPCIQSRWGQEYFRKLYQFFKTTGFDLLEHDGSYPGDTCASTTHPGHKGYLDSQWTQWKTITDFYRWCRGKGIYLNVPDFYYLNGSNKCGMGYRETNWSLPRAQQIIHGRQNIYDGTWQKTPSMGWMFVPLTQYHGGGAAATIEPLHEHLDAYEAHLANNLGLGVQACYRGPRLYDTDQTKAVVKKWVDFYKKYRAILESDLIHVRRPDGRWIDGMLHVNPQLKHKGLAMVYNPLTTAISTQLKLPLYYTGLIQTAKIREQEGPTQTYTLDRKYNVLLPISMPPQSVTWFIIE